MNNTAPDNTEQGSVGSDYWVKQGVQLPMTTIRVTTNRYASLCQSILTLANDANVAALDSKPSCSTIGDRAIEVDADTLHHLHRRAVAIAKAIESIASTAIQRHQGTFDSQSPATTPVDSADPGLSLSSAGDGQTAGESTPCTGEGNSAGASSRAPLRSS